MLLVVGLVFVGCGSGGSHRPPATATPTPERAEVAATPAPAGPAGPWSAPIEGHRMPLPCPVASSRAGWPSRVLDLGDHSYVKLWGRRPRLASVDAQGHLYDQTPLGARKPSTVRALACWRGGRTGAAWTEYRGSGVYALRVALRPDGARTVDVARAPYDQDGIGDVALAFTTDGSLLVVYSVHHGVRAVTVSASGAASEPVTLGPAFEITEVAAQVATSGRVVVAWTTIDAGEERNERRRVYAVMGRVGRLGPPQLVQRAPHLNSSAMTGQPGTALRLAVAPNGRALLMWGLDRPEEHSDEYSVRVAEAGAARAVRRLAAARRQRRAR